MYHRVFLPGKHLVLGVAAFYLAGCASSAPPPVEAPEPVAAPAVSGAGYLVYYADSTGIWRRDTRVGEDDLLLRVNATVVQVRMSPDGRRTAVVYREADGSVLSVIDGASGNVATVHTGGPDLIYTLQWSRNGSALGVGFYEEGARRGRGERGVLVFRSDGSVHNVGCSVSNRFAGWRSNGTLVVGDGTNLYIVSANNCGTLFTLEPRGRSEIAYSPDGSQFLYSRSRGIRYRNRRSRVQRSELFLAQYNGRNGRKIVDYNHNPGNARWSPDGRKIAFEAESQDYANITHLAIYDVRSGRLSVDSKEKALGLPSDGAPCWSHDGARIAYDRAYVRRTGEDLYYTKQRVVRNVATGDEQIIAEELSRADDPIATGLAGDNCGWVDARHLAVAVEGGVKIVNVDTNGSYELPPDHYLLLAAVYE
jgi:dipeptidyl aminopeptidase/acylaminoacyl peptidase